jgi:hypothetical protein
MVAQVKRFNWVQTASNWETFQGWQDRRKAMRTDFENTNSVALSGFATAWSNQISGSGDLAANAALARITAAAKAKLDKTA